MQCHDHFRIKNSNSLFCLLLLCLLSTFYITSRLDVILFIDFCGISLYFVFYPLSSAYKMCYSKTLPKMHKLSNALEHYMSFQLKKRWYKCHSIHGLEDCRFFLFFLKRKNSDIELIRRLF